ncbi:MAG: DUF1566 domain-containing protein, partial [Desulfobacteraceae bacterium]|nr:DUF1566 domain-containing protein [Desulfobacteraceae bacterium]
PLLITTALPAIIIPLIPDVPKPTYGQIIYTLLVLALIYTTFSLTFLKIFRDAGILTLILILIPLCMSLSVGSAAYLSGQSPGKIISVIVTLLTEREVSEPSEKSEHSDDRVRTPDATHTEREQVDEAVSESDETVTGISENEESEDRQDPESVAGTDNQGEQAHVGDIRGAGMPEPTYKLRSDPETLSDDDVRAMIRKHNFYYKKYSWTEKWHNESGDFKNAFTDNGDDTVTDNVTGLIWQKSGSDKTMKYDKTQAYIDDLNRKQFAGYNDWRLPTLEELASLLEKKQVNSFYIDPVFDNKRYWLWTADKRASGGAWGVDFGYGDVYWSNLDGSYYVRGVRSRTI